VARFRALLPNKPRGVPRVDDRRLLKGIFWVCGRVASVEFMPAIVRKREVPSLATRRRDYHPSWDRLFSH
jgi:transposase